MADDAHEERFVERGFPTLQRHGHAGRDELGEEEAVREVIRVELGVAELGVVQRRAEGVVTTTSREGEIECPAELACGDGEVGVRREQVGHGLDVVHGEAWARLDQRAALGGCRARTEATLLPGEGGRVELATAEARGPGHVFSR